MTKRIDLHIHTTISDGVLTPKEVIDEAVKNGVAVISIADHDTIDAYTDEIFEYAKSKNIKLIPAVEISTKTKKSGIHVLGYNFASPSATVSITGASSISSSSSLKLSGTESISGVLLSL